MIPDMYTAEFTSAKDRSSGLYAHCAASTASGTTFKPCLTLAPFGFLLRVRDVFCISWSASRAVRARMKEERGPHRQTGSAHIVGISLSAPKSVYEQATCGTTLTIMLPVRISRCIMYRSQNFA